MNKKPFSYVRFLFYGIKVFVTDRTSSVITSMFWTSYVSFEELPYLSSLYSNIALTMNIAGNISISKPYL